MQTDRKKITALSELAKKAHLPIRAIRHNLRLTLLNYLADNPATNVTTLYKKNKLEQSVASQHLGILRKAGLVFTEKTGKEVLYSVDGERLQELIDGLTPLFAK